MKKSIRKIFRLEFEKELQELEATILKSQEDLLKLKSQHETLSLNTFDTVDEKIELEEKVLDTTQKAIDQAKEKAELFSLGIESQENLDKKIAEYQDAKTAYDEAKGAL